MIATVQFWRAKPSPIGADIQKKNGEETDFIRTDNGYFLRLTTTTFAATGSSVSRFSMPTFLTMGFQILSGIHAGALAGFFTCFRSPVKTCTFLVPRSRSLMSVMPRLAAFRAACRGAFPVKTPISLPSLSCKAKFLISFSAKLSLLDQRPISSD